MRTVTIGTGLGRIAVQKRVIMHHVYLKYDGPIHALPPRAIPLNYGEVKKLIKALTRAKEEMERRNGY